MQKKYHIDKTSVTINQQNLIWRIYIELSYEQKRWNLISFEEWVIPLYFSPVVISQSKDWQYYRGCPARWWPSLWNRRATASLYDTASDEIDMAGCRQVKNFLWHLKKNSIQYKSFDWLNNYIFLQRKITKSNSHL